MVSAAGERPSDHGTAVLTGRASLIARQTPPPGGLLNRRDGDSPRPGESARYSLIYVVFLYFFWAFMLTEGRWISDARFWLHNRIVYCVVQEGRRYGFDGDAAAGEVPGAAQADLFKDVFAGCCRLGMSDAECVVILGVQPAEFDAWLNEFPEQRVELEAGRAKAKPSARELLREHAKASTPGGVRAAIALARMPDEDVI